MNRSARALLTAGWLLAAPALALAQEARFEVGGFAGWTWSDGVTGGAAGVPGVGVFSAIEPGDSFSWGLHAGYSVSDAVSVELLFDRQESELRALGTSAVVVGDMAVENYHGVLAYHFAERSARVRPFVFGGLGVTRYGQLIFGTANDTHETGGDTRFSTTWGAGVKLLLGSRLGLRLHGRWTPTYIKADTSGWWCDPYWGCYVLTEAQYANQLELAAGVTLRF